MTKTVKAERQSKNCGNCQYWVKLKSKPKGLCEFYDFLTRAQDGKSCKAHKALKYRRESNV